MITKLFVRLLGSATVTAGLAAGFAAIAAAQPIQNAPEDDFWECVAEHQDTDGIGVCCVFYGGDYDEPGQACYIDFAQANAPDIRPTTPRFPVLTVPTATLTAIG